MSKRPLAGFVTSAMAGGPITVTEVPPAEPVKDNLVAFARAIRGEAPYPITGEDLVNNISILEAIITSAARDGDGGEALIRTMQDMKALISETPEKPIIADIPMPPIKVTLSEQRG